MSYGKQMGLVLATLSLLSVIWPLVATTQSRHVAADLEPRAVVLNGGTERAISFITPATDEIFGPFISGALGPPGSGVVDVVLTSDARLAIASNPDAQKIYFIKLDSEGPSSNIRSVDVPLRCHDIDLSPDDRFLLVTGAFHESAIVSIDVRDRKIVDVLNLPEFLFFAEAVSIASDGQTVLVADLENDLVHVIELMSNGSLRDTGERIPVDGEPANIAISPDGKTAIVCNLFDKPGQKSTDTVTVLRIDEPLHPVSTLTIRGLPGAQQSAVFSHDGSMALVLSVAPRPDTVSILNVFGPGMVTDSGVSINLPSDSGTFLGVDVLAVAPDNSKAYVGNPGLCGNPASRIAVIDLISAPPRLLETISLALPVGIAFPSQ